MLLGNRRRAGEWEVASSWIADESTDGCAPYWKTYTMATTLGFDTNVDSSSVTTEARFALVVQAVSAMPLTLADVVVAPLGVSWASMR